jgi:hypothetical protein
MTRRSRHDGPKPAAQTQYLYDGRTLIAVIELRTDSRWHVIRNGKDVASYSTRQGALDSLRGAA